MPFIVTQILDTENRFSFLVQRIGGAASASSFSRNDSDIAIRANGSRCCYYIIGSIKGSICAGPKQQ